MVRLFLDNLVTRADFLGNNADFGDFGGETRLSVHQLIISINRKAVGWAKRWLHKMGFALEHLVDAHRERIIGTLTIARPSSKAITVRRGSRERDFRILSELGRAVGTTIDAFCLTGYCAFTGFVHRQTQLNRLDYKARFAIRLVSVHRDGNQTLTGSVTASTLTITFPAFQLPASLRCCGKRDFSVFVVGFGAIFPTINTSRLACDSSFAVFLHRQRGGQECKAGFARLVAVHRDGNSTITGSVTASRLTITFPAFQLPASLRCCCERDFSVFVISFGTILRAVNTLNAINFALFLLKNARSCHIFLPPGRKSLFLLKVKNRVPHPNTHKI